MSKSNKKIPHPLKERIHEIIFEADTPAGKAFDISLLIIISLSIIAVMLESIDSINQKYADILYAIEWIFTIIFTIEYLLRLYCVYRPSSYAFSFFGIIDLLAIIPSYLELLVANTHYLMVIRALRLLRIFRIFKLGHFLKGSRVIIKALKDSRSKITVFLTFVLLLVIIIGAIMYVIEGGVNSNFSSIPRSVYWAIVTLTTVGYGDIYPITPIGQFFSAMVMILGYAVIAVPTGIVSAEFVEASRAEANTNTQVCRFCVKEGHDDDAIYCKYCGEMLNVEK